MGRVEGGRSRRKQTGIKKNQASRTSRARQAITLQKLGGLYCETTICALLCCEKPTPTSMIVLLLPVLMALVTFTANCWPLVIWYSMNGVPFTRIRRSDNRGLPLVISTSFFGCRRFENVWIPFSPDCQLNQFSRRTECMFREVEEPLHLGFLSGA